MRLASSHAPRDPPSLAPLRAEGSQSAAARLPQPDTHALQPVVAACDVFSRGDEMRRPDAAAVTSMERQSQPSSNGAELPRAEDCGADASQSADAACPRCHGAALRLHDLEAATERLRAEVALGERRLHTVLGHLALAEDRAGHGALAGAIRSVLAGQSKLSFDATWALHGEHPAPGAPAPVRRLGPRELQVLRLITEGDRSPSIAGRLGITVATVEVHRRNIMRKLDLHTVAGLTKYALRQGLTSL